jgi:hypothetical protein
VLNSSFLLTFPCVVTPNERLAMREARPAPPRADSGVASLSLALSARWRALKIQIVESCEWKPGSKPHPAARPMRSCSWWLAAAASKAAPKGTHRKAKSPGGLLPGFERNCLRKDYTTRVKFFRENFPAKTFAAIFHAQRASPRLTSLPHLP